MKTLKSWPVQFDLRIHYDFKPLHSTIGCHNCTVISHFFRGYCGHARKFAPRIWGIILRFAAFQLQFLGVQVIWSVTSGLISVLAPDTLSVIRMSGNHRVDGLTTASTLRQQIEALLVAELGYTPERAHEVVQRHEGLMLKSVMREQSIGPIALSIHLANQLSSAPLKEE